MLIKKVRLENIRSFLKQEIVFRDGITLLAGDIGSGKSTILLALDFALFGIRRGEMNGSTLLRNGREQGSIEVVFSLEGKEVVIKRTLKRTANGVTQDFGYMSVDNVGREMTAVELKQAVLDLLCYPQDMLTKKSMIYRYTVYTPQEEMKMILMGSKEERLETLRKVFNIDKYRKIVENAKIVMAHVREKWKINSGKVYDLEEKKRRLGEREQVLVRVQQDVQQCGMLVKGLQEQESNMRQQLLDFEEKNRSYQELVKQKSMVEVAQRHVREKLMYLETQVQVMRGGMVQLLGKPVQRAGVSKVEIQACEEILRNAEVTLKEVVQKVQAVKTRKEQSRRLQESVTRLDVCPTCKQQVHEGHKQQMHAQEEATIALLQQELVSLLAEEMRLEEQVQKVRVEVQALREREKEEAVFSARQSELEKQKGLHVKMVEEKENEAQEFTRLREQEQQVAAQLISFQSFMEEREKVRVQAERAQDEVRKKERELVALQQQVQDGAREVDILKREVVEKEQVQARMRQQEELRAWFDDVFIPLVQDMERNVLLRVHHDLNGLFRVWFQKLVENDQMQVRLDEEFTPLIEQNGYDTEYENLSGGEKTAAALAYRLALNQVINKVVTTLNTKDLVILDEPTDGFSSQQIEKMRDVLRELNMRQIILVSHEQQMENFVDQIVRLEKDGHVSAVVV